MTFGGEGETLELLDAATRGKLCDVSVDAESKSPVQFLCTLAPQTAIEAGEYLVRLTTLAGGESTLWPVELKVGLLEAAPAPAPVPRITTVHSGVHPEEEDKVVKGSGLIVGGENLADASLKIAYTGTDGEAKEYALLDSEYHYEESSHELIAPPGFWDKVSADTAEPATVTVTNAHGSDSREVTFIEG